MTSGTALLSAALVLLSGCETLNDAFVRHSFTDHGLSGEVSDQIIEGLERREKEPLKDVPSNPAPPFMDLG